MRHGGACHSQHAALSCEQGMVEVWCCKTCRPAGCSDPKWGFMVDLCPSTNMFSWS